MWQQISINNYSNPPTSEINGVLQVNVATTGAWAQAGYVTKYAYDTHAFYPSSSMQGLKQQLTFRV